MPLYEYHCDACDADFELLVRSTEQPACPSCHSPRLEKRLSVPAAPVSGSSLPVAGEPWQGCGRRGCGPGGCAM